MLFFSLQIVADFEFEACNTLQKMGPSAWVFLIVILECIQDEIKGHCSKVETVDYDTEVFTPMAQ